MRARMPWAGVALLAALLCAGGGLAPPARAGEAPPAAAPGGGAAGSGPSAGGGSAAGVPLPPPEPAPPAPAIRGFRGALFGMTEPEVRAAIGRDFHLPAAAIKAGENAVQRTPFLTVKVADLAPGTGGAFVTYLFGYKSHALIAIDIVWSRASDPQLTPARLKVIGERLRDYFAAEHFAPGKTVLDALTDAGLLLFRTVEPAGPAITLLLSGPVHKAPKGGQLVLTPNTLSLSYLADATHPDVFRLQKGAF